MSSSNVTQCAETKDTSENITTRRRSNDDLLSGLSYPSCHFSADGISTASSPLLTKRRASEDV